MQINHGLWVLRALLSGRSVSVILIVGLFLSICAPLRADFLFVTNEQSTSVGEYTTDGQIINRTLIGGLNIPTGIAISATGDVFIASGASSVIGEYTAGGQTINASLIALPFHPFSLALDGMGDLYVTGGHTTNVVAEYTTSGAVVHASMFSTTTFGPYGIALDGSGHIFIANSKADTVGEYDVDGTTIDDALIKNLNFPDSVAYDGMGSLFITTASGTVEYTTAGVLENAKLTPQQTSPTGLALDGHGNLFVGGPDASFTVSIGEYTTGGQVENANLITGLISPLGLAIQPLPEPTAVMLLPLALMVGLRRRRTAR
jgi:sugar lactone lactonase YvrE